MAAGAERRRDWARRAALHYLERYASSEANLAKVLQRKLRRKASLEPEVWSMEPEEASALIAEAIAHCRSLGLTDDSAFADMKVASGRRKGHSTRRILGTLAAKGVDRSVAAAALDVVDEGEDRLSAITYARRRRLGPFRTGPRDAERDRRDVAALCRQGFSYRVAKEVVALDQDSALAELGRR